MIQRIQSLYLLVAIAMLAIVSFTGSFFTIVTESAIVEHKASGIFSYTHDKQHIIEQQSLPLYIITILVLVFAVWILFSFKKLAKQLRLAKILWGVYFLLIISIIAWNYLFAKNQVEGKVLQNNYDVAFYLLVIGVGFVHLAFMGIRKDKATIDSLSRLR